MAWYLLKAQKNHWSKEQRSLRVFENGVLKRTFWLWGKQQEDNKCSYDVIRVTSRRGRWQG